MTTTTVRRIAVLALSGTVGCASGRVIAARQGPSSDWGETLAQAEAAASQRRYADADRLLAEYASRFPGTEGAVESAYWRGVIALEPGNHDGSPQMAAALFDTYAKAAGALPHRLEADILRHLALQLVAPPTTAANAAGPSGAAASPTAGDRSADLKAKDAEIQRLKDELAKANDELERIKRRLTAPTKP
jgi:TolA-binding protein